MIRNCEENQDGSLASDQKLKVLTVLEIYFAHAVYIDKNWLAFTDPGLNLYSICYSGDTGASVSKTFVAQRTLGV